MYDMSAEDLHNSVLNGDIEELETLLMKNKDIELDEVTYNGETLLCTASSKNNHDIINFLLKKGVDIDRRNDYGDTPLNIAIIEGTIDTVKMLIDNSASLEITNDESLSPLFIAISRGSYDITELLIKSGANIRRLDGQNRSTIILAIEFGFYDIVKLLLKYGFNPNRTYVEIDIFMVTPLVFAIMENNIKIASLLIEWGANVNGLTYINSIDDQIDEESPLQYCIEHDLNEMAILLINSGVYVTDALLLLQNSNTDDHDEVIRNQAKFEFIIRNHNIYLDNLKKDHLLKRFSKKRRYQMNSEALVPDTIPRHVKRRITKFLGRGKKKIKK